MNRCIHCTRCVRFMTEVAGVPELGAHRPRRGHGDHDLPRAGDDRPNCRATWSISVRSAR
jgi:hypothetical protein